MGSSAVELTNPNKPMHTPQLLGFHKFQTVSTTMWPEVASSDNFLHSYTHPAVSLHKFISLLEAVNC